MKKQVWLYFVRSSTLALRTATILYHESLDCFEYPPPPKKKKKSYFTQASSKNVLTPQKSWNHKFQPPPPPPKKKKKSYFTQASSKNVLTPQKSWNHKFQPPPPPKKKKKKKKKTFAHTLHFKSGILSLPPPWACR